MPRQASLINGQHGAMFIPEEMHLVVSLIDFPRDKCSSTSTCLQVSHGLVTNMKL